MDVQSQERLDSLASSAIISRLGDQLDEARDNVIKTTSKCRDLNICMEKALSDVTDTTDACCKMASGIVTAAFAVTTARRKLASTVANTANQIAKLAAPDISNYVAQFLMTIKFEWNEYPNASYLMCLSMPELSIVAALVPIYFTSVPSRMNARILIPRKHFSAIKDSLHYAKTCKFYAGWPKELEVHQLISQI